MPPTALTLKFFSLPKLSLLWLEKLSTLRNRIIEKKQNISKIKIGAKDFETDKITKNLLDQSKIYNRIKNIFEDDKITQIMLVLNPDTLSINESIKIRDKLQSLKLDATSVFINKYQNQEKDMFTPFRDVEITYYPQNPNALIGLNSLSDYAKQIV